MSYLNCPRCGLTAEVCGRESAFGRCPRCARGGAEVAMSSSAGRELQLEGADIPAGGHVLSLTGELDLRSAPRLEARVLGLCAAGARTLTLDLTALTFVDSRGLLAMLLVRKRCASCGCRLSMVNGSATVDGLSEIAEIGSAPAPAPAPVPVPAPAPVRTLTLVGGA